MESQRAYKLEQMRERINCKRLLILNIGDGLPTAVALFDSL